MRYLKIRPSLLFLCIVALSSSINAQENVITFTTPNSLINMYNSGNNLGVNHKLNNALCKEYSSIYHTSVAEAEFLEIESAYRSGGKDVKSKIIEYKRKNHDALYSQKAELMLGNIYVSEGNFDEAEKCYAKINSSRISAEDQEEYVINKSILFFNKQEYTKAEEELREIATKRTSNRIPAIFYMACANYAQEDFSQAEEGFIECRDDEKYGASAKYYLTNIHFVNKRYSSALTLGEELLNGNNCPEAYTPILKKICGESAFAEGYTDNAIKYLQEYIQTDGNDNRSIYLLGVSYYNKKEYADAIKTLVMLTNESNEFSQSAYLYLGHSYLQTGDKNGAMFAYEKAMAEDNDMQAKESAMFNYCALIEESNILPFDKKVEIYENYINLFPESINAGAINQMLAASYYNTKNYKAALTSVNKVNKPSKELLKAKQVILYNLGTEEFEKKEYSKAKEYFNQSIVVGDYSTDIKAKAYLWRGEINYMYKDYSQARNDFMKHISLLKQPDVNAYYSLAYTLFMQEQYGDAEKQFSKYIVKSKDKATKADAYNRKGDCLYMTKNYSNAIKAYGEAEKTYNLSADYSLYMQGIIYGVLKQHSDKIEAMNSLVMLYPFSAYAPKAIVEKGNAQIALNQNDNALSSFAKVYDMYPKSNEARQALLQSALIYMKENENDKAVSAYKTLIEEYSGSNEAKIAMEDLKNYHIQQGDIEPYAEYIKQIKGEEVYSNAQMDSLSYYAAESAFLKSPGTKSVEQLKNYINKYPNGTFKANASFYIGQYSYNQGNLNEASQYFENVLVSKNVILLEETLLSLASIEEMERNYEKAYQYYNTLAQEYSTTSLGKEAKSSVVRVLSLDGKNNEVIKVATEILSENSDIPYVDEIMYYRAKAYNAIGDSDSATKDWEVLSTTQHSAFSTEAKYMIAEILYNKNMLTEAENCVNSLLSSSSNERYWIARGIILLSDISAKQGDNFKAKQYLNSLKNNYTDDNDIQTMIKERLTQYEN